MINNYMKKSQDVIIKEFKRVHNNYDYSLVKYDGAHVKVSIICKKHGVFLQTPNKHKTGRGCPSCANEKRNNNRRHNNDYFLRKATEIHGEYYDYSLVGYKDIDTPVEIQCPKHGKFKQSPYRHLSGRGCMKCARDRISKQQTKTTKTFILEANGVHGNVYDYSLVEYLGAHKKIKIKCPKHDIFEQSPRNHLNGNKCPKCNRSYSVSKISQSWLDFMNISVREMRLPENRLLTADGFDEESNTIFLFHGDYWHGNPVIFKPTDINPQNKKTYGKLYENTIRIENEMKSYGYNLEVMWEKDWRKQQKLFPPN